MKKLFFFISGLPRSGSTLLCNVLMQNPEIYASATSGLIDLMVPIRNGWNQVPALAAMPQDEAKQRLTATLKGCLIGYYEPIEKPVIFDKNRGWLRVIPMLESVLGEKVKILVTVRDLPQVFASFEKLFRKTGEIGVTTQQKMNPQDFVSVESRVRFFARSDQLIGSSLNLIKDAQACGYTDRMHFVDFKHFTNSPKATLEGIYNFLGLSQFDGHDFDHVEQLTIEDDRIHGWSGLHEIRSKITYPQPDYDDILGKDLAKSLRSQECW